jgi:(2R)-phospho-3-sulfolactate synthase (ComA)
MRGKVRVSLEAFASTLQACAPQTTAATSHDVSSLREMKQQKPERSFPFLRVNERERKPRKRSLTEIRGPCYSTYGRRHLEDLLEPMGAYVDSLKFAGGSFTLMPERAVRDIIELCHEHDVLVSTGGFIERVLVQGDDAVGQYVAECKKPDRAIGMPACWYLGNEESLGKGGDVSRQLKELQG